jgi:hypothetical protein
MIESRELVAEQLSSALERVESNTDSIWRAEALSVIRELCLTRDTFICDDVWDLGLRSTHNDKALGPVMIQAAKLGWCRKTDRVRPSRRSHLSGKPVWESQLRAGEVTK